MTLHYDDIYSIVLSRLTDYSFLEYDEQFIYDQLKSWLRNAASSPRMRAKFQSIKFDDEIMRVEFELKDPVDEQSDEDFVKDVLARGCVIEWLEPQVKNVELTKMMVGGKEERYSQTPYLKELQSMLYSAKIELQKVLRDHGYLYNSYVDS